MKGETKRQKQGGGGSSRSSRKLGLEPLRRKLSRPKPVHLDAVGVESGGRGKTCGDTVCGQ